MPLAPGDRLGPYEISASIGKGGMGEVYRAHDSRLGRDVAIKVSAEHFSERFEREARAIAALNHPNICTLFDIGPDYLVMEYIEGDAPKGPLPMEEALRIARQIGDALQEAHSKNITHRDLKPGNIKVKPDGTVKVLDFGLAKLSRERDGAEDATMTMGATLEGAILQLTEAAADGTTVKIVDISCPQQMLAFMRWSMDGNRGLVYVRVMRTASAVIYGPDYVFEFGKGHRVRSGPSDAAIIITSGRGVHEALAAADACAADGISVGVVDMPSIDEDLLTELYATPKEVLKKASEAVTK